MNDEESKQLRGAGGGSKKSSAARAPVIAPDSAQSKALLCLLDLLGEGQIKGLVNGSQSIIIDGTPLTNADSSPNFNGFTWEFRDGKQSQAVIAGFPDVSTPFNVGVQVKQASPYTLTVNDPTCDQVRVIVNIPSLSTQNTTTGDVTGAQVQYKFQMSVNNGAFADVNVMGYTTPTITINDKVRSKYQREHLIALPKPATSYKIRMIRITADSLSANLTNDTFIDSYYEILDSKLTYPNSVMCGFKIDASQFSSMPARSYLVDGMFVQIPTNYNPDTREYVGIWDGSFKIGYTNNPAWILYDLMLNTRYGLGEYIKPSNINIAKLYTIGRYCDGLVTDGQGGMEPRFTLNTVIAAQKDAYKVVQDICSVFRGMAYWSAGAVQFTQDAPSDPQFLFNNANVVDGMFNRVGSARKDRHSVVHVMWNDPLDQYKQKIEYVEDKDLIDSLGYRKMDTQAFGCTSRAQAHRIGLWILYTESVETNIMTFDVGLQGLQCVPGDIVKVHDQYKAGKREGGRLKACTRTVATLDVPTQVAAGSIIAVQMPDGKFEEKAVVGSGLMTTVTFASQLSTTPMPNAVWILTELNLVPQLARVVGVSESETANQYTISVVDHNPSKYGSIEQGLALQTYPTTILDPTNSQPESMKIEEVTYLVAPGQIGTRLEVSWVGRSPSYFVSWRSVTATATSGWKQEEVANASFSLPNVVGGAIYDFSVVSKSTTGKLSKPLVGSYTTLGTMNPPSPPTGLTAVGDFRQVNLAWINSTVVDFDFVEIFENTVDNVNTAYLLDRTPSNNYIRSGVPGLMKYWYWVRTVNKRGMRSAFNSTAGTSAIAGLIAKTDLEIELNQTIDDITSNLDDLINDLPGQVEDSVNVVIEKAGGLSDRVDEAFALAQAARSGSNIEEMMREDDNFNIRREVFELNNTINEDISSAIQTINETAVSDRAAVASQITVIEARFDTNEASLVTESTARATADSASATRLNGLDAKTDTTNAAIVTEQTVRANADSAMATSITGLVSKTDTTNAALTTEQTTRANADSAQVTSINSLIAKTDTTNAALVTEQTTRANADSAMATNITALQVKTDTTNAGLVTEQTTRANADSAISTTVTNLTATVSTNLTNVNTSISSETTARANADTALGVRIDSVVASNGTNAAAISSEITARANADSALTTSITNLTTKVGVDIAAAVNAEITSRSNADGALSTRIDTAQATANGATASVSTTSTALSTLDGKLSAQWTAKVQTSSNGSIYMAGMGVGIQATDQGIIQTAIIMQADRFIVMNPANSSGGYPFQIIGGVCYINAAMIQTATITNAHIQDAAITYAKIGVAQIAAVHIQDAQITTAKIVDLNVTTLKIGNESVTIPRWAGYAPAYGTNGAWQTPLTLTFTMPVGGMVFVTYCSSFGSYGTKVYTYQLVIDGNVAALSSANWSDSSITLGAGLYLAAGSHTVTFQINGEPGCTLTYQNLLVQGIMK